MARIIALTAVLGAALLGCGHERTLEDNVDTFCRGRIACALEDRELADCVTAYLNPSGDAHQQCEERTKAACLGSCFYYDGECLVFTQDNACLCDDAVARDCPP